MNTDTQSVAELEALLLAKLIQQMRKNFEKTKENNIEETKGGNNEIKTEHLMEGVKENFTKKEQGQLKMILEDPVKFDKTMSAVETAYYKELASIYYKEKNYLEGYKEVEQKENSIQYESIKYGGEDTLKINVDFNQQKITLNRKVPELVKESLREKVTTLHQISFQELENSIRNNQKEKQNNRTLHMAIEKNEERNTTLQKQQKDNADNENDKEEQYISKEVNETEINKKDILFNGKLKPMYYENGEPVYDPVEVNKYEQQKLSSSVPVARSKEVGMAVLDEQNKHKLMGLNRFIGTQSSYGGKEIRFDNPDQINNREENEENKEMNKEYDEIENSERNNTKDGQVISKDGLKVEMEMEIEMD